VRRPEVDADGRSRHAGEKYSPSMIDTDPEPSSKSRGKETGGFVASQTDIDFGQIAVQNKLINKKQLEEALDALDKLEKQLKGKKGKKKPRLVDVLVQKKL